MRKTVLSAIAVAMLLVPAQWSLAQAPGARPAADTPVEAVAAQEPVVVLSLTGYNSLIGDINFLGELAEQPQLSQQLEAVLTLFTQGQGLAGVDKTRPWGAAVSADLNWVAFVPVDSLDKLMAALAGLLNQPEKDAEGVYTIQTDNASIFAKESNGWAYFSMSSQSLESVPADPSAWLGDLPTTYDVAIRANVQNIPMQFRQMAIDGLRSGVEMGMEQLENESDEEFKLRKQTAENQVQGVVRLINETNQLTIGWVIDDSARVSFVDLDITVLPDGALAEQIARSDDNPTMLPGFVSDDAVATMHMNTTMGPEEYAQLLELTQTVRDHFEREIADSDELDSEAAKTVMRDIMEQVMNEVDATIKKGHLNAGLIVTGEGPMNFAAGVVVADGKKLEQSFRKLIETAQENPPEDFPTVKLDAGKHAGFTFHTLTMEIPEDKADKESRAILGDKLHFTLAFGADRAMVALGDDGMDLLKQVIDAPAAATEPPVIELTVALTPILKLAAKLNEGDPKLAMLAESMEDGVDDRVIFRGKLRDQGINYRIEVREGVLKLLGAEAKSAAAQGGANF